MRKARIQGGGGASASANPSPEAKVSVFLLMEPALTSSTSLLYLKQIALCNGNPGSLCHPLLKSWYVIVKLAVFHYYMQMLEK